MRLLSTLLLLGLAFVAGCAHPQPGTAHPVDAPPVPVVAPTGLRIPTIGVDSRDLVAVGVDTDGTITEPPVTEPHLLGWFFHAPVPGEVGPAVILGHVSGRPAGAPAPIPGVFARLAELDIGDRIEVDLSDGRTVVFEVSRVATVPKIAFPTREVYGDTAGPEIRLITCGGVFDEAARSYESNVIAWARLVAGPWDGAG